MAVGDRFQDLLTHEFAEGRLALLVTGGTEATLLTREGKQVLMAAGGAADAGKAPGEHPAPPEALQSARNHIPEWAVPWGIALIVHGKEGLSVFRYKLPE